MVKNIRLWLPLLCFSALLWAGLYVVFWLDRVGCDGAVPSCLANAFGNWMGDVVMLKWVKSHQEMIGGIAALAAAGAVVWTTVISRQNELHDRERADLANLRLLIEQLRRRWVRVSFLYDTAAPETKIRLELNYIVEIAERLPSSAYQLAAIMMISADAIAGYFDEMSEEVLEETDDNDQDETVGGDGSDGEEDEEEDCEPLNEIGKIVYSATAFFYGHTRLIEDGSYHHSVYELDEEDIAEAAELGLTAETQDSISEMLIEFPAPE